MSDFLQLQTFFLGQIYELHEKRVIWKNSLHVRKLFQRECWFNINYICQRLYNCRLFQIVSVSNNSYVYSKCSNSYVLNYLSTNTYFNDICEYTYSIYRCWHLISWISFPSMISFILQDLCWARNRLYIVCTVCSFSFGHIKLDITKKRILPFEIHDRKDRHRSLSLS